MGGIVEEFEAAICRMPRSARVCGSMSAHSGGWLYRLRQGSERGKVARSASRLLPVRMTAPDTIEDEQLVELSVADVFACVRVRASVGRTYVAELVARLRDRY
jgi:hypothetical protein